MLTNTHATNHSFIVSVEFKVLTDKKPSSHTLHKATAGIARLDEKRRGDDELSRDVGSREDANRQSEGG